MVDAYDVLGVSFDAGPDDVKKAYRRLSLQHHPDKVQAKSAGDAEKKFMEIKAAYDILQDSDRRRAYDAFGFDFGQERPEKEVWSIGITTIVSPMGTFMVKTAVALLVRALAELTPVKLGVVLVGMGVLVLYYKKIIVRGFDMRSPALAPMRINFGVIWSLTVLHWAWPLLFDAACVFYLASEVSGVDVLVRGTKIFAGAGAGCLLFARLVRGWWLWLFALEAVLLGLALFSCGVASGTLRLYIDSTKEQHGEKIRKQRSRLRAERQRLSDEADSLRQQVWIASLSR